MTRRGDPDSYNDAAMAAKTELVEASLRQGHKSLLVSRLRERHAVAVASQLDKCGFAALEVFGGATFEAQIRFLAEQPFDRLRAIRSAAKTTPLLATITGQGLVGHRHYADDVVKAFVAELADCGVNELRISDPLNDVRNYECAITAAKKSKLTAEGVIGYSPELGAEELITKAKALLDRGCDRICLHDALGVITIRQIAELISALRMAIAAPIGVAISAQTGQADLAYEAALRNGAQRADVALSPLAGGSSYPAAEAMISAHADSHLDISANFEKVADAATELENLMGLYAEIADPAAARLDSSALRGHLPVTAMGHALTELADRNSLELLPQVEEEITRVRRELGSPPMVTPLSEIIATQAVYNVCDGERYITISQEVKDYCLGLYGTPPNPIDSDVQRLVNGREEPITLRPADLIEPGLEPARRDCDREGIEASNANVLGVALFGGEWVRLVKGEVSAERLGDEPKEEPEPQAAATAPPAEAPAPPPAPARESRDLEVEVDGQNYTVRVTAPAGTFGSGGGGAVVAASNGHAAAEIGPGTVTSPMQGLIIKVSVNVGDSVAVGAVVAVLEAMKMQNDITATSAGTVQAIHVEAGAVVSANDPVVTVS